VEQVGADETADPAADDGDPHGGWFRSGVRGATSGS
jgi:hypothetical protein